MALDIVVILIVAFGFYAGFSRGIVKTVFDTLSLFIGIMAAMILTPTTIGLLEKVLNLPEKFSYFIGLVVTFIAVMAAVRFIGRRIENVLESANINILNKIAGGAFQGLFFAFILSMILWTLGNYNVLKPETKQNSMTYPLLEPLPEAGKAVFTAVKPIFKSFWDKTVDVMQSVADSAEQTEN